VLPSSPNFATMPSQFHHALLLTNPGLLRCAVELCCTERQHCCEQIGLPICGRPSSDSHMVEPNAYAGLGVPRLLLALICMCALCRLASMIHV